MSNFRPLTLKGVISTAVRAIGHVCGLEIRRTGPRARDDIRLANYLARQNIEVVLDIGANRGQFARQLFQNGFKGRIVSFEALPKPHADLSAAASRFSSVWQVAPQMALTDCAGTVDFYENEVDVTSSLLSASDAALNEIPGITTRVLHKVPARRLDDEWGRFISPHEQVFLKIDVQGGEGKVIEGAKRILDQVTGLVIELSLAEIYKGQPIALDMLSDLTKQGFSIYDIYTAYRNPFNFRLDQIDVVMFRSK